MLPAANHVASQPLQLVYQPVGCNSASARPKARVHDSRTRARPLRRDRCTPVHALPSTIERQTDHDTSPAIEQLYNDILSEKRRLLESNFDASPDFEQEEVLTDNRRQFERQWTSHSASTSDSANTHASSARSSRRQRVMTGLVENTARRRNHRYANVLTRGRTAKRRAQNSTLLPCDPTLVQTAEGAERESLKRLFQVEDQLRVYTDVDEGADIFGIDLRPAAVLPRRVEIELTVMIRKAILAERTALDLQKKLGRPPSATELVAKLGLQSEEHLQLIQSNKRCAHQLMLRHNARLVAHVAKKYQQWDVDMTDLVTEGMVGLERAIEKFEPEKGYKFSTYAFWWIRQKVSRCAAHQSRVVAVPIAVFDTAHKIKKARHELEMRSEEPVTDVQVAEAVGLSTQRLQRCLQATRQEQSTDNVNGGDGDKDTYSHLEDTAAPAEGESEEVQDRARTLQSQLDQLLNSLPARDRNIIRMHYGLHDPQGQGMQLRDISRAYGVCHERVRKIEAEAVQRLSRDAVLQGIQLPFARTSRASRRR